MCLFIFQACSFLLSNPDVLNYNSFYESVISILSAGSRCDKMDNFSVLVTISGMTKFLKILKPEFRLSQ